jgi:catechol 2,3-dioxygenase-like lactoylglutathione lyase family enzyme
MHHVSIRTADIHRAIAFYEQLGFQIREQFTAGITLACWMEGLGGRIELLQVPEPRPAADAFGDEHYTGYYHLSFDLSAETADLPDWLADLRAKFQRLSEAGTGEPLHVLLEPTQQMIGRSVYEVAFIADTDGLPLEFLRLIGPVINPVA